MSSFIPQEYFNMNPNDFDNSFQKYRSISVMPNTCSEFDWSFSEVQSREEKDLSRAFPLETKPTEFPVKPMKIGRYSFTMREPQLSVSKISGPHEDVSNKVVRNMNTWLGACNPFHFTFVPGNTSDSQYPMWKGKCLTPSTSCEVEVHIFHGDDRKSYIVDAVRIEGDATHFHTFFQTLKCLALNTTLPTKMWETRKFPPLPQVRENKLDMSIAFKPIFAFCQSEYRESRLEGVKMFYNIFLKMRATNEQGLNDPNFIKSCVTLVDSLIFDEFDEVSHHAILFFGYLSKIPVYKSALIESQALPFLSQIVEDMPNYVCEANYSNIFVQRECASIIFALSHHDSPTLVSVQA